MATTVPRKLNPIFRDARWLLIVAHLMALAALAFGLLFLLNTNGGTVFLFSAVAPLLVLGCIAAVLWIAIDRFRRRHSLFSLETFEPGQWIIRQGEPAECAYFIQSGQVEILRHNEAGDVVLSTLQAGQYFGEMALLSGEPRNASVRALTAVTIAALGKHNFLTLLHTIPSTREDIITTVQKRAMKRAP